MVFSKVSCDYLLGRFAAGTLACLLIFAFVMLGMFLGQFMPWIDPKRLGPVSLTPLLWALAVIVLPNLLFAGALLALLAAVVVSGGGLAVSVRTRYTMNKLFLAVTMTGVMVTSVAALSQQPGAASRVAGGDVVPAYHAHQRPR